jgi:uncharacterized low-complexity protein
MASVDTNKPFTPKDTIMLNTKTTLTQLIVGGVAVAGALSAQVASASPFQSRSLDSGYQVAQADTAMPAAAASAPKAKEGKCGEGKCGAGMKKKMKHAEGKCGADKKADGKCGADKKADGKCGADKHAEGKCGADKK